LQNEDITVTLHADSISGVQRSVSNDDRSRSLQFSDISAVTLRLGQLDSGGLSLSISGIVVQ